jgi:hypothetical protein
MTESSSQTPLVVSVCSKSFSIAVMAPSVDRHTIGAKRCLKFLFEFEQF